MLLNPMISHEVARVHHQELIIEAPNHRHTKIRQRPLGRIWNFVRPLRPRIIGGDGEEQVALAPGLWSIIG